MENEYKDVGVLSKKTLIPLSLAILFIGFFARQEYRITKIETLLETHIHNPMLHHNNSQNVQRQIEDFKHTYYPRQELEYRLEQINSRLSKLEK